MFGLQPLPRTLGAAVRDVRDPKPQVRISALRDLSRHAQDRVPEALAALTCALRDDAAEQVRAEAALAIADAGAEPCVEALLDAIEHDVSARVRQLSLVAVGELGGSNAPRAERVVEGLLHSSLPELRFQAIIAWYRVKGEAALPRLFDGCRDPDAHIRYVCFRLLEEHWLGRTPAEQGLDLARAALDDAECSVRLAAAILLAHHADPSGTRVLVDAINGAAPLEHPEDEQAAVELAGNLGLADAVPGLQRRAWGVLGRDPSRVWHARVALARLGDERARSAIARGLRAWTRDTRTLAVAAAGKAGLRELRSQIQLMRGDERRADPQAVEDALRLL